MVMLMLSNKLPNVQVLWSTKRLSAEERSALPAANLEHSPRPFKSESDEEQSVVGPNRKEVNLGVILQPPPPSTVPRSEYVQFLAEKEVGCLVCLPHCLNEPLFQGIHFTDAFISDLNEYIHFHNQIFNKEDPNNTTFAAEHGRVITASLPLVGDFAVYLILDDRIFIAGRNCERDARV